MSSNPAQIQAFITKWQLSGAAERANAQLFLAELCDILGLERPQPSGPDETQNAYCFEKAIPSGSGTTNFIDLYKRGHFVLECKQGVADGPEDAPLSAAGKAARKQRKTGHGKHGTRGFDTAMIKAHAQAQRYARALPKEEVPDGRPPFVVVVDVGHSISLYTDWTRMGGEYLPFPDPASYRIPLKGLLAEATRATLRAIWTDPLSLDPGRRSAKVTREIADSLAKLARSLEGKHPPEVVAAFLMRSLFTMFAEDVDLLPFGSFTKLLGELKDEPGHFKEMLENLWATMNTGGLSPILRKKLPRFNGGLFAHADAIRLNKDQIQLLLEASAANWKDVEPAIFGTLLERALDPRERHKLGAHYTPRAYVERLVNPTVIEPLRAQWKGVQVAALQLAEEDQPKKAIAAVEQFLYELGNIRVLDPACGSGNFLYVTLELLKRLEGEVLNTLAELGQPYKLEYNTHTISPANFFGIELNPRAAAIAEQVLWIGFLQWQLRTQGHLHNLPEPLIKDLHNIENRDAVLAYDSKYEQRDAQGNVVTRWDGRTTKPHPVTGEPVPDPEARETLYTYTNPRPAQWPQADYIVGNPPFIGDKAMRLALGDEYTKALRDTYTSVPDSADFVMYWWDRAAELSRNGKAERFGFITTKGINQTFNRRVLQAHLDATKPLSLVYAIPNHPWVDSSDGAAVRIAMSVGVAGKRDGVLQAVVEETQALGEDAADVKFGESRGRIHADLSTGPDVAGAIALRAGENLHSNGMMLAGAGFILDSQEAAELGLGKKQGIESLVRRYRNGRDLAQNPRDAYLIDLFGQDIELVRTRFPEIYQRVFDRVKPERDQNRRDKMREKWWLFGESRITLRKALVGLTRYIATPENARHRFFVFLETDIVPDHKLIAFALDDAYILGVLSSGIHSTWAVSAGGRLGVGNDPIYNKSRCFDPFPFPACTPAQQEKIRALGEQLDAHRKRQQALHPELTMTGMYNVLEAVRAGTPLSAKEKKIYEQGLVGILKQLHDELDAAVAEAYGWSGSLLPGRGAGGEGVFTTEDVLARLVALNAERAKEEANGLVRWLRPSYQAPEGTKPGSGKQAALPVDTVGAAGSANVSTASTRAWPAGLPAQAAALRAVLHEAEALCTVEQLAAHFTGKTTQKRLAEMERLLHTMVAMGAARHWNGKWAGV
ncbi:MAG: class I SAM-dependent DNA methyltransferase [Flavobacteriales bacterium]|nr:class I SAM-dependent DNA methyltransferase [Flavobacteriales bacterium]